MTLTATRADALLDAYEHTQALHAADPLWATLTENDASAVASRCYARVGAGSTGAWKLGALDVEAQEAFGISSPVVAPLIADRVQTGVEVTTIRRHSFIQPRFEAEIGVRVRGDELVPVPCVEVADSRFRDWVLPPSGVTADFGLQGGMLFGVPGEAVETITVDVEHDGVPVSQGTVGWDDVCRRLQLLDGREVDLVATGSVTPLVDVRAGRWTFTFHGLGEMTVVVV